MAVAQIHASDPLAQPVRELVVAWLTVTTAGEPVRHVPLLGAVTLP